MTAMDEMAKRAIEDVAECLESGSVNDADWAIRRSNYVWACTYLAYRVFPDRDCRPLGWDEIQHPEVVSAIQRNWPKPADGRVPWSPK